jgi:hypothetical protein
MCGAYDTYGIQIHTGCVMAKPEGKQPLGRPRSTWKDKIKMDLK